MSGPANSDEWNDLLPRGYRIEVDASKAPDKYVLYRDGQYSNDQPVGHCWPSLARAICYAHYLDGAIGPPPKVQETEASTEERRLRAQGLRPVQIWVPDVESPVFATEASRQSLAVANSPHAEEDQAFIDSISTLWDDE